MAFVYLCLWASIGFLFGYFATPSLFEGATAYPACYQSMAVFVAIYLLYKVVKKCGCSFPDIDVDFD